MKVDECAALAHRVLNTISELENIKLSTPTGTVTRQEIVDAQLKLFEFLNGLRPTVY